MPSITRSSPDDLELLVELRLEFVADLHPEYCDAHLSAMRGPLRDYFAHLMAGDRYQGYFAWAPGGDIAAACGLLRYDLPPLHDPRPRRIGHVLNFFTRPPYRRMGYGRALMEHVKLHAAELGIDRLSLHATAMGEPLYRAAGFVEPGDKALQLDILNFVDKTP